MLPKPDPNYYKSGDTNTQIDGRDTEWIIAQRKIGNLPPPPKEEQYIPTQAETEKVIKKVVLTQALSVDEQNDRYEDTNDEEELKILRDLREKRLKQLREEATRKRFGKVMEISGDCYVREVTNADPKIYVVVHLYADSKIDCKKVDQIFIKLAYKHLGTKFVRIKGCLAIKDFPEKFCPAILIYKSGKMLKQFIGLGEFGGVEKLSENVLEWFLAELGVCNTELKENPLNEKFEGYKFKFKINKNY